MNETSQRTLVIWRRRGDECVMVARAPFEPRLDALSIRRLTEGADLLPTDMLRIEVDPPFHSVTRGRAREISVADLPNAAEGWGALSVVG